MFDKIISMKAIIKKRLFLIYWILALTAYVGMTGVLIFESCLPGQTSAKRSTAVGEVVADVVNVTSGDTSVEIEPTSVSITNKEELIDEKIGYFTQLDYEVLPKDASYKDVTFESSDPSVIRVDQYGNVKYIGEGTATIKIKSTRNEELIDETDEITVSKVDITNVEITLVSTKTGLPVEADENGNYFLYLNQRYSFNSVIEPRNATNKTLSYSVDKSDYISISGSYLTTKKMSDGEITTITPDRKSVV